LDRDAGRDGRRLDDQRRRRLRLPGRPGGHRPHPGSAGGGEGQPLKVSETIIRNIRVLATDQRTSAQDAEGKPEIKNISTVTLEATPKISEKIAVAQTIGQISLSLRSIADNNAELERAIASGEVTVPDGTDPKAERQLLIAIASKPADENPTFTVGADVSRFQRSSVPSKPRDSQADAAKSMTDALGSIAAPSWAVRRRAGQPARRPLPSRSARS
jgi:pilus assembly protein CpaB